ncbi:hypothetical protein [Actinoplanes sp. TFC3]|uniref:hypothetical protein n=1 Tax=Actinoplanes sp. TFC3 TaxID=1710355 RepID=UPI0035141A37
MGAKPTSGAGATSPRPTPGAGAPSPRPTSGAGPRSFRPTSGAASPRPASGAGANNTRPTSGAGAGGDEPSERGLRGLVGSGSSQVSVGAAMRARDAARPTDADLAEADASLSIVRRNWVPREELPRGGR